MKRQREIERERAEAERKRLDEHDQPSLDPAKECKRCFGTGTEIILIDGYNTAIPCDHEPVPF